MLVTHVSIHKYKTLNTCQYARYMTWLARVDTHHTCHIDAHVIMHMYAHVRACKEVAEEEERALGEDRGEFHLAALFTDIVIYSSPLNALTEDALARLIFIARRHNSIQQPFFVWGGCFARFVHIHC